MDRIGTLEYMHRVKKTSSFSIIFFIYNLHNLFIVSSLLCDICHFNPNLKPVHLRTEWRCCQMVDVSDQAVIRFNLHVRPWPSLFDGFITWLLRKFLGWQMHLPSDSQASSNKRWWEVTDVASAQWLKLVNLARRIMSALECLIVHSR